MLNRKGLHYALFSTSAMLSASAHANSDVVSTAPGQGPNTNLDSGEIVVTAQKRSERLSDVPLSITAATGAQLVKQGINNPADLTKIVPGFTYQQSAVGVPIYAIRGIGFYNTFLGVTPTVTVYLDQVPLPYSVMAAGAGLDLERVEVLKGPQGTLFGQNSTGGAISYIAAKPTRELHAGFNVTYGRFNQLDVDGFVSGPLSNTLSARLFVRNETRGNWQRSDSRYGAPVTISPTLLPRLDDTLGKRSFRAARFLLDWAPSDRLKFELGLNGWRDTSDTQAQQFQEYVPSIPGGRLPGKPNHKDLPARSA